MDCAEVKELLSCYFDDELASEEQTAVANHLVDCHECADALAEFGRLSDLARGLDAPKPPPRMWPRIQQQLDEERSGQTLKLVSRGQRRSFPMRRLVALAATILVAAGLGWYGSAMWFGHGEHDAFNANIGHYVEVFGRDPVSAQQFLLAKYAGQAVEPEHAARQVGYRPLVADGLPGGYTVQTTYVMKMPCCTCVQCLCQRSDGTTIAIIEHDDEVPAWFGDRRVTEADCNGTRCSLVELDDRIAASWKHGKRHITVIGARDAAEIGQFAAWFEDRQRIGPL